MTENKNGIMSDEIITYRVLGLDDSKSQRRSMQCAFLPPRFDTTVVSSGEEVVEKLTTSPDRYDIVLLDVNREKMDAFEVCSIIRNKLHLQYLPVLLVTSDSSWSFIKKSMDVGADELVIKPYNSLHMMHRVNIAVEQKRLFDGLRVEELALFATARMVEAKDNFSNGHCDRLAHGCKVFATELGLSFEDIKTLTYASFLHDIGKLAVPDAILNKPVKLSKQEMDIVKKHPEAGSLLSCVLKGREDVAEIIRHHHERYDGSGYPDGLRGVSIPFLARVFQIVDLYDSLSSDRAYKRAINRRKLLKLLSEESQKGFWDRDLMSVFLNILTERPDDLKVKSYDYDLMSLEKITRIIEYQLATSKKARHGSYMDERR